MFQMSEMQEQLYYAVLNGDLEKVRLLLNKGWYVNGRFGSELDSYLHIATHVPIIHELLQQGADANALNLSGESPLLRAVVDGKGPQVVSKFLSANADVKRIYYGATLLHYASDVEVIRMLLSCGLDVNSTDFEGRMPLHYAAVSLGPLPRVRELLQYGAYVNAVDNNGETPLHSAVSTLASKIKHAKVHGLKGYFSYRNAIEVVQELLDYGADINIINYRREYNPHSSTLGIAINCGCYSLIEILIKSTIINYIDIDYRDLVYLYPFHCKEIYDDLNDYLESCAYEIDKIKTENVSGNFLLRDFIGFETKRNIKPLYIYNIDEKYFRENYPIYCGTILSRLQFSIERGNLLEKLRDFHMHTVFESSGKTIVVIPDCLHKIGEYLSSDDIKHFMEALDPQH